MVTSTGHVCFDIDLE